MKTLFTQYLLNEVASNTPTQKDKHRNRKINALQKRLDLKNQVTVIYSQFLAYLRWNFLALEKIWLKKGILSQSGDIFFLEYAEIQDLAQSPNHHQKDDIPQKIAQRRQQYQDNQSLASVPYVIYGNAPSSNLLLSSHSSVQKLQGIGASIGQVEGHVKIIKNLQDIGAIAPQTILVVPYTDSGWTAILSRAAGIIAEVGGKLSHGAIIAREYGIPAVMDVHNATQLLKDGQLVRIDGQLGRVEILE